MNRMQIYVVFSLHIILSLADSPALLMSTAIRLNKIVVSYPTGVISERDLDVCQPRAACNIIHKRFWLPPTIERLCRCPHRNACPWVWSDRDNQTIYLNNRSQMKLCTDLSDFPICTTKKVAVTVSTLLTGAEDTTGSKNHTELQSADRFKRQNDHRNITITCNCQEPHYWKPKANASKANEGNLSHQAYYCSKLKKCARSDFCGYVRVDTHSTFYRCSCPKGHMCITKNKTIHPAEEILYNGNAYKAYCLPIKTRPQRNF